MQDHDEPPRYENLIQRLGIVIVIEIEVEEEEEDDEMPELEDGAIVDQA